MNIRTVEDDFEYQVKNVFQDMLEDYTDEQNERKEYNDPIESFADWLWSNSEDFGEKILNRFDEYTGIEESTENLNFN